MSELAVPDQSPNLPAMAPPSVDLVHFASEASHVHKIAQGLANTSFVPKAMQGRPDEITGAILAGREIGLSPMTALASINIIQGTPALEALAMRALAQAAGIEFELVETTNTRCVMRARPKGRDRWTEVTWTLDDAKAMKLTGKDNWQKMPRQMLIARATSELCRLEAAPVIKGLAYSQEELRDHADDMDGRGSQGRPSPRKSAPDADAEPRPPQRTAQREPIQATVTTPAEAPTAASTVAPAPSRPVSPRPPTRQNEIAAAPEPDLTAPDIALGRPGQRNAGREITDTTRRAVMAAFGDVNVRDRDTRIARVKAIVGADINSVNQLTEDEGKRVVHALKNGIPDATAKAAASWGEPTLDWSDVENN